MFKTSSFSIGNIFLNEGIMGNICEKMVYKMVILFLALVDIFILWGIIICVTVFW